MNIGVLGGTFNPIHYGHIEMAKSLLLELSLDKILFVVSGNPPHKDAQTDKYHRLNMTRICLSGYEKFEICDIEVLHEGYSYTIETLNKLKLEYLNDDIRFITGADMFVNIPSWFKGEELLTNYSFIAVNRSGFFKDENYQELMNEIIKKYSVDVKVVDIKTPDVSSSKIREMLKNNEDVSSFMPKGVIEYIKEYNLYK